MIETKSVIKLCRRLMNLKVFRNMIGHNRCFTKKNQVHLQLYSLTKKTCQLRHHPLHPSMMKRWYNQTQFSNRLDFHSITLPDLFILLYLTWFAPYPLSITFLNQTFNHPPEWIKLLIVPIQLRIPVGIMLIILITKPVADFQQQRV